jgi:dipeptidyl aminopeptidase/acylaminoacyl peptidase
MEIHGGPHTTYGNSFFHEFQILAGHGFGVLYTNPRGSLGYGEEFARACVGDWCGVDADDLQFMAEQAAELDLGGQATHRGDRGQSGRLFHQLADRAY